MPRRRSICYASVKAIRRRRHRPLPLAGAPKPAPFSACPDCQGRGHNYYDGACPACQGSGSIQSKSDLRP
jgi:hypothetical protein